MVEDLKRKLLIVLAVLLLLSSAQAGGTDRLAGHHCTDFQTANLLLGSKLKVQFLLFTSSSPSCGELILANDGIKNSSFNSSLETKIIIHGFRALGTKPSWVDGLVHAILHTTQVNVIAVDWVYGSTGAYPSAVENVTQLALSISQFISKLLALGVSGTSIHIIGVSLGAHVGGLVGHFHGGQLGRITDISLCRKANGSGTGMNSPFPKLLKSNCFNTCRGLDPAGPKYTRASPEERLDPGDALFVEAIHTDADNFGIRIPVGHIDYFVNGGKDQPGCPRFISAGLLKQAGVNMRKLPKEVEVYLMTSPSAPFCTHHSLVEFHLQKKRNRVTSIEIAFFSNSTKDTVKITIPKQQEMGKRLLAHRVPLCQINSVTLKYLSKNHFWKKDESFIVGKFCAAPLPLDSNRTMSCLPWNLTLPTNMDISYELPIACA
ncbi:phospholipase A1 member A isoform X4 [Phalacrocorax aristotelis]|uniref:phospholipase A1 member A isoform X4 n=1 Tax=Phalacrocorax aristotelis TaxID=126867 RepID=UPI003F4BD7A8